MRQLRSLRRTVAFPLTLLVGLILVATVLLKDTHPTESDEAQGNLAAAVDFNPDPTIFETALVAMEAHVDLGNGVVAKAETFNGTIPGPEIRLKVGDRVIVHFTNLLAEPSTIHWHGIELDNESDGTGITQNPVLTGETFTYRFTVPRAGVFLYHAHIAPTNPSFKGFYGPLIVEDPAEKTLIAGNVLPSRENTKTLVLADTTVCKAAGSNDTVTYPADPKLPWVGTEEIPGHPPFPGLTARPSPKELCETPLDSHGAIIDPPVPLAAGDIPNIEPGIASHGHCTPPFCPIPRSNEGQLVLTNGRVPPLIDVRAGEGVRLPVISAAALRYFRLRLTDQHGQKVNAVPSRRAGWSPRRGSSRRRCPGDPGHLVSARRDSPLHRGPRRRGLHHACGKGRRYRHALDSRLSALRECGSLGDLRRASDRPRGALPHRRDQE